MTIDLDLSYLLSSDLLKSCLSVPSWYCLCWEFNLEWEEKRELWGRRCKSIGTSGQLFISSPFTELEVRGQELETDGAGGEVY